MVCCYKIAFVLIIMTLKIAIVGSGAVGLNYGLRLLQAELGSTKDTDSLPSFETFFVVRSDFEIVRNNGVVLHCNDDSPILFSPDIIGDRIYPNVDELVAGKGKMDMLIVATKSYSYTDAFIDTLYTLCHEATIVLLIVNGLGVEEKVAKVISRKNIVSGISFIGCNRVYFNPPFAGPITVRNFNDNRLEIGHMDDELGVVREIQKVWQQTSIADLVKIVPSMLAARWCKLSWNITFGGIAVALGGLTVDVIVEDPSLHELANKIMTEVLAVARADILFQRYELSGQSKHSLSLEEFCSLDKSIDDIFPDQEAHLALMWRNTVRIGAYKSSVVVDFLERREMEISSIFSFPLQKAKILSQSFPSLQFAHFETVVLMIEGMQSRNSLRS